MKKKERILEKQYLEECLSYEASTGVFTWKERPLHHFKSTQWQKAWNTRFAGLVTGYQDSQGHLQIKVDGTKYAAHRLAFIIMLGECPDYIDHIDQDKTNNSFNNLRACTTSQNKANVRGNKGVYPTRNGKWRAQICKDYKIKYIGTFDTQEEAMRAYQSKHVELFGEFSVYACAGRYIEPLYEDLIAYGALQGECAAKGRT